MTQGQLTVTLKLGDSYSDISHNIVAVSGMIGKQHSYEPLGPSRFRVVFLDPFRLFDPLNTDNPGAGDLGAGARIEVRMAAVGETRVIAGVVQTWSPTSHGGDNTGTVILECVGVLSRLAMPPKRFANQALLGQAQRSKVAAIYSFQEYTSLPNGTIFDATGSGNTAISYSIGSHVSAQYSTPSSLLTSTAGRIVAPFPPDPLATSPEGFTAAMNVDLEPSAPYGANGIFPVELFAEGDPSDHLSAGIKIFLYLYQTGQAKLGAFLKTSGSDGMLYMDNAGATSDWLGQNVSVALAVTSTEVIIGALNKSKGLRAKHKWSHPYSGKQGGAKRGEESNRLHEVGGWEGDIRDLLICHGPTSEGFIDKFFDQLERHGWASGQTNTRLDSEVTALGLPASKLVNNFRGERFNEYAAFPTVLAKVAALEQMEHGRVFENRQGGITALSYKQARQAAIKTVTPWSDQPGAIHPYLADSCVIRSSLDGVVNSLTLDIDTGETVTAQNAVTIAKFGLRHQELKLPFTHSQYATLWAHTWVSRWSHADPYVSQFKVAPDRDPQTDWVRVLTTEIGDAVQVVRQPMGIGSKTVTKGVLEGLGFVWAADSLPIFTFYVGPAGPWTKDYSYLR